MPSFSEVLAYKFASASTDKIDFEISRLRDYCTATIRSLRSRTDAPILWLSFEPIAWPSYGIFDSVSTHSQRDIISYLNSFLSSELNRAGNAWLVDTGICLERVGASHFYDWRYWHLSRAPYSRKACAEIAHELLKHVRALSGRVRKCLVLDCDNTLWGGVIGEDGLKGIKIGNSHPGIAYREFQLAVLELFSRGVILCLCSKNNECDVLEVLRHHTEMVLRESHFSAIRVNWRDKVANLREIASELNIGLDSLVFVDDSDFELSLVKQFLPDIATLKVSRDSPFENRLVLAQCGLFDTHSITKEDGARAKMYASEAMRKQISRQSTNLEEYLHTLEMRLCVAPVKQDDLDRAVQLCQRTNQFNLTCTRYTRDQLLSLLNSDNALLLLLRLSDRFGDYGTVGFCMIKLDAMQAHVDTFLISCRALGRGAESAFLALSIEAVSRKNVRIVTARYVQSGKNSQVKDFYTKHGFPTVSRREEEVNYCIDLQALRLSVPSHFKEATLEY